MASKRKINQDDLRKMMAKVKTGASSGASVPKRYKISSREKALMEEQEKQKSELRKMKEAQNKAMLAKIPPAPLPDAKPQKSILKNTSYTPQIVIPSNISLSTQIQDSPSSVSKKSSEGENTKLNKDTEDLQDKGDFKSTSNQQASSKSEVEMDASDVSSQQSIEVNSRNDDIETNNSNLPEGFFDDPVQDAKARNVPYVNVEEEEWEKFQKEIGEEMSTAQTILVEDREEATADRQIEEIDEQMEAWRRVSKMEQKIDQVNLRKNTALTTKQKKIEDSIGSDNSDSNSDDDYEEFVSWRKKK